MGVFLGLGFSLLWAAFHSFIRVARVGTGTVDEVPRVVTRHRGPLTLCPFSMALSVSSTDGKDAVNIDAIVAP